MTSLLDVLKETDVRGGFTEEFQSGGVWIQRTRRRGGGRSGVSGKIVVLRRLSAIVDI